MGIYISGVKGLPEQVQKNKEDIKTIQDEIEGIDFEQIRALEEQVAENTGDINNLENAIGVQNQAINTLNDDVDALESKTQLITYNSDYGMTDFANSIEVADDVYASNVRVMGDGSIVNTSQSGMHFKEGANDDTLTIANNDGATPHYLHFNADGTLDIDGNPVGGKTLYNHNVYISISTLSTSVVIQLVLEKSTPINTNDLMGILNNNGFNSSSNYFRINDYVDIDLVNSTYKKMIGIYSNGSTLNARVNNNGTTVNPGCTVVIDNIIPTA